MVCRNTFDRLSYLLYRLTLHERLRRARRNISIWLDEPIVYTIWNNCPAFRQARAQSDVGVRPTRCVCVLGMFFSIWTLSVSNIN